MKLLQLIIVLLFFGSHNASAQNSQDFSGEWVYQVKETPYGDFYGTIFLNKSNSEYSGKIINKAGREFTLEVLKAKGSRMIILSNIEDSNATLTCTFKEDILNATVEVEGDDFLYKLEGKKKSR